MKKLKKEIISLIESEVNILISNVKNTHLEAILNDVKNYKHYDDNISRIITLLNNKKNKNKNDNDDDIVKQLKYYQTCQINEELSKLLVTHYINITSKVKDNIIELYYDNEEIGYLDVTNRRIYINSIDMKFLFAEPIILQHLTVQHEFNRNKYGKLRKSEVKEIEFVKPYIYGCTFSNENHYQYAKKEISKLLEETNDRIDKYNKLENKEIKPANLFNTFITKYHATIYKKHYLQIFSDVQYLEQKNLIHLNQTLLEVEDYINDYNNNQTNKEFKYPINKKLYEIDKLIEILELNKKEKN